MTIQTALQDGARLLEDAGIDAPRLSAEVLLCYVLGCERPYLYGHPEKTLDDDSRTRYQRYLQDRSEGKPTQYITSRQEFYGREFRVGPGVFIPRPETEHLIETALRLAPEARSILDVGCGSGAIAITLSLEMNRVVRATERSFAAIAIASDNARRLGASVEIIAGDLVSAIRSRSVDLLVSNPPYIPTGEEPGLPREVRDHEPRQALYAGPSGLDVYQRLIEDAARVLCPPGWLMMELGYRLLDSVRAMFDARWHGIEVVSDLAGLPRVLAARFEG